MHSKLNIPSLLLHQTFPVRGCFYLILFILLLFQPFQSAGNYYEQQINPVEETGHNQESDSAKVVELIALSREIHRKKHNDSLEHLHAERAVEVGLKMGDTLLYAKALDNLGLLNRFHQRYEEAIALHGKAFNLVIDKQAVLPLTKMIFANNAGVASRYAQQLDKAVLYYKEALKIAEEENDLKNIAISSNGLGNTFLHIENREKDALNYFKRALAAEKTRGNSLGVAMNYLSISDYYSHRQDFQEARKYLDELLALNIERKDTFGLAITYEFFGLNYFEEGVDLKNSELFYIKSLELFNKLENTHKMADVLLHLGAINEKNENFNKAIDYYTKSAELAKGIESKGLLMAINSSLSAIYEKRKDFDKALKFYKISQQYKDSLNLKQQETQIAAIEKRFAIDKKESQIALLEKDKVLQEAQLLSQEQQLKSKNFVMLLLLIGLIAIVTIAMMQYRNIRIRKKSNRLLKEQNNQISQQKDEIEKVNTKLEEAIQEIVKQQKKNEERRIKLIESDFENKIQNLALQSLESQMNPHFLFNGMNAVRWLVIQNKNEKAMKYLDTFANLLRLSLTSNRKNVIELSEELRTTSLYLEIEKLRFDSEFTFSVDIADEINLEKILVPPKILQPLAENAVKHGLLPSRKANKQLAINVIKTTDGACIEVTDNGMGFKVQNQVRDEARPDGTHLGLKLIEERLSIYNQKNTNKITFKIAAYYDEQKQLSGTKAQIFVSLKEELKAVAIDA